VGWSLWGLFAKPRTFLDGFFRGRLQAIQGLTAFLGQVVNASAASATANDVRASNDHQPFLDKVAQGHVKRRANKAQAFCHAR
jgi:hypothetical protein